MVIKMPVSVKNLSEVFGKDVFTNRGAFCGRVVDLRVNLQKFRIQSIVLDVAKGSFLAGVVGNKRGVVVPYTYVDSVGDVVIIKHITTPALHEDEPKADEAQTSMPFTF